MLMPIVVIPRNYTRPIENAGVASSDRFVRLLSLKKCPDARGAQSGLVAIDMYWRKGIHFTPS